MSACRSCRAPIIWARSERGGKMPLEPAEKHDTAVFVLRDKLSPEGPLALACGPAAFQGSGEQLFRSHFATCPQAAEWRNDRAAGS